MSTSPADPVANPTASATASPGQANPTTGGFIGLRIGVLTVSDTRTEAEDVSGKRLVEALESAGHDCAEKAIVRDDAYQIRAVVSRWIAAEDVERLAPRRCNREPLQELPMPPSCLYYPAPAVLVASRGTSSSHSSWTIAHARAIWSC